MRTRGQAGFTIIELMIVVAIMGVLLAIGIPAFDDLIKNNRRTTVVNELISSLTLARAEAAKRGQGVVVCAVSDANNNGTIEASEWCVGTDWSPGWGVSLWTDTDNDGDVDGGELVAPALKVYLNDYAQSIDITATDANAILQPFNRATETRTITVCDARGASRARAVELSANGRSRTVVNNVEDTATGAALSCS